MITIIISAPAGGGKSQIARGIIKLLRGWGFINFEVYTTNMVLTIPPNANKEE